MSAAVRSAYGRPVSNMSRQTGEMVTGVGCEKGLGVQRVRGKATASYKIMETRQTDRQTDRQRGKGREKGDRARDMDREREKERGGGWRRRSKR